MSVKTEISESSDRVAKIAARILATLIRSKPNAVIGLATGATPVKTYAELIRLHRTESLSFAKA
ncbi:MAG: glucosamine-6-phosphate deaminase, partial [bacterium]|nr:glucosamine-6-phosphate deaminase [bacterium]